MWLTTWLCICDCVTFCVYTTVCLLQDWCVQQSWNCRHLPLWKTCIVQSTLPSHTLTQAVSWCGASRIGHSYHCLLTLTAPAGSRVKWISDIPQCTSSHMHLVQKFTWFLSLKSIILYLTVRFNCVWPLPLHDTVPLGKISSNGNEYVCHTC